MKHSDGSHVVITVTEEKGRLKLMVKDNGNKMPPSHSDGQGMDNMAMRAKKIGGSIDIRYSEGFCVELEV